MGLYGFIWLYMALYGFIWVYTILSHIYIYIGNDQNISQRTEQGMDHRCSRYDRLDAESQTPQ